MPALVQIDQRVVDFAMFLRQRNFLARNVDRDLKPAPRAFEFLEMVGNVFCGDEFVSEQRTHELSRKGIAIVGN